MLCVYVYVTFLPHVPILGHTHLRCIHNPNTVLLVFVYLPTWGECLPCTREFAYLYICVSVQYALKCDGRAK